MQNSKSCLSILYTANVKAQRQPKEGRIFALQKSLLFWMSDAAPCWAFSVSLNLKMPPLQGFLLQHRFCHLKLDCAPSIAALSPDADPFFRSHQEY